jgi:heme exporter protein CcmD
MITDLQTFIAMGGYGRFVWTAYGLTCIILLGNLYVAKRDANKIKQALRKNKKV